MSERRISAGELEARYKMRHELFDFWSEMEGAILDNFEEKQDSWKTLSSRTLLKKLREHLKARNWVDVANFAFMLHDKQRSEFEK